MINVQDLLENEFKEFTNQLRPEARWFQKCYRAADGHKLYFVQVGQYDIPPIGISYYADAQFTSSEGEVFNVNLLDVSSIEQLEEFFANIFYTMSCKDYD